MEGGGAISGRRGLANAPPRGAVILWFPSCWYDLARLGNDSLAAMAFSGGFLLSAARAYNQLRRVADYIGLGVALGCGLLTKAFFVPVYAGVVAFLVWSAYSRRRADRLGLMPSDLVSWRHAAACLTIVVGLPLLMSCAMVSHVLGTVTACCSLVGDVSFLATSRGRPATSSAQRVSPGRRCAIRQLSAKRSSGAGPGVGSNAHTGSTRWMAPLLLLAAAGMVRRRNRPAEPAARQVLLAAAFLCCRCWPASPTMYS